jgi:uncharacterized protein (DUF362 family)
VAELYRIFPRSFAIVDGIVGMEGNGPIQGRARACGAVVMGDDLAAVDATCCRIMGIDPAKIEYLQLASGLGPVDADRIEQRGDRKVGAWAHAPECAAALRNRATRAPETPIPPRGRDRS